MTSDRYPSETPLEHVDFSVGVKVTHGPSGQSFGPFFHSELEFLLVLRGKGQSFIGDANYSWEKNSLFVIHKNEMHASIPSSAESSAKRLSLMFASHLVQDRVLSGVALKRLENLHHLVLSDKQAVVAEYLLNAMAEEFEHQTPYWQEIVVMHIESFLVLLLRAADGKTTASENKDPIVQETIKYIDEKYAEDPSLEALAERVELPANVLSKRFKHYVGFGMREYLLHRRILEAQKLLENTDLGVAAICSEVGFESVSSFYHDFQAMIGISPAAYRRVTGNGDEKSDI